jgi:hypothetical protein
MINLEQSQGKYRFTVADTISICFGEKNDTVGRAFQPGFYPAGLGIARNTKDYYRLCMRMFKRKKSG